MPNLSNHALGHVLHWLLGALIVTASCVVYVPLSPLFPAIGLDSAWGYALNAAVARGMVFGRDIIFTFGPYASAYTEQYHPATAAMMLWSSAILGGGFAAGVLCLTRGWQRLSALLLTVLMVMLARDAVFFAIPFIALLLTCRVVLPATHPSHIVLGWPLRLTLGLLVIALSLLPLIKGTFAAASGVVMTIGWLLLMIRRHKLLAVTGAALFFFSMAALWVIAGQPLAALPAFFLSQGPVASGYTDAMSSPGGWWLPGQFIICCLLLGLLHVRRLALVTAAKGLGAAALLFFAFKGGFVRPDGHALIAAGTIVTVAWLLSLGRIGLRPAAGLAIGLISWATIEVQITGLTLSALKNRLETPFETVASTLADRLRTPDFLASRFADAVTLIRAQHPLPPLQGTADIYSYGQAILLAHGLDWSPRPLMQSYLTYLPILQAADAAHLAGPSAPDNVLFSVQPIDGQLPSLEDGASWPLLLTRYAITDLSGDIAILRRRDGVLPSPAADDAPPEVHDVQLGQPIPLPESPAALWARIDIAPTLLGKLVGALYKPPRLSISYRFTDGHEEIYRYVAGMGASRFLAAPLVRNTNEFIALALPKADQYLAPRRPRSITLTAEHGIGWLWQAGFTVAFSRAEIPAQPAVSRLLFDRVETAAARLDKLPTTAECALDLINMKRPEHIPVRVGAFLEVDGWAAISVKDSAAPDSTAVTLTAPNGEVTLIKAKKIARDDVNRYFQKPAMGQVGYTAYADVSALAGDYLLGLELSRGGQSWTCTTQLPVHIGE